MLVQAAAALNTDTQVVTFLVEPGAEVIAKENDRSTPLHAAAQNGRAEVVTFLVDPGADVTASDNYG